MITSTGKIKYAVIILIVLVICSITIILILSKEKPRETIERLLGIDLPSEVIIEEFTFYKKEDGLKAKILIPDSSLEDTISQTTNFLNIHKKEVPNDLPNFINTASWWDLNISSVEDYYYGIQQGKIVKTREIYVFITKEENGEHYFYISY